MQSYELMPAFADPVTDSQQVFRVVLEALSEPGVAHELHVTKGLDPLSTAAYALALMLLDSSTTVWLSPTFAITQVQKNLLFHCGCRLVERPEEAMFAFLTEQDVSVLAQLNVGTERDPDLSCTAIVQLTDLVGGQLQSWSGPGIQTKRSVAIPIKEEFWQLRVQKNQFPLGVDVFFVAQNQVMGLPRTTRVTGCSED